jgi:hypothetical protein
MSGDRAEGSTVHDELRAPRAAGVAGLVFAALFTISILLLRGHPSSGSSAAEVEKWYLDSHRTGVTLVGIYLVPFAGITFLWFTAVLRQNVVALRDRFFDTVLFGSALLFIAMLFAAAAAAGSLLASVKFLDAPVPTPDAVGVSRAFAYTFFYVYALRAAAVFMIVTSTVGLRGGGLPRWLALAGYALAAVLLLSVSYISLLTLLFPAWVTAVSVVILLDWRGSGGAESADASAS